MLIWPVAIVAILHGLVHFLYAGQSWRAFELQPGMLWPDRSWAMSQWLSGIRVRQAVAGACGLAGLLFVFSGLGVLFRQPWSGPVAALAAIISVVVFGLAWDGRANRILEQGGLWVVLSLILFVFMQLLRRPLLGF